MSYDLLKRLVDNNGRYDAEAMSMLDEYEEGHLALTDAQWTQLAQLVNNSDDSPRTLLKICVNAGHSNVAKILVEHGALISYDLINRAIQDENLEMVTLLVNACIEQKYWLAICQDIRNIESPSSDDIPHFIESKMPADFSEEDESLVDYIFKTRQYDALLAITERGLIQNLHKHREEGDFFIQSAWKHYFEDGKPPALLATIIAQAAHANAYMKRRYPLLIPTQQASNSEVLLPESIKKQLLQQRPNTYPELFSDEMPTGPLHDKSTCLKILLTDIHTIMNTPDLAIHFLKDFDRHLMQQWNQTYGQNSFQPATACPVVWKEYSGLLWPFPILADDEKLTSKNNFLDKQCLAFFQKRGFGEKVYALYDALESDLFLSLISSFTFFKEKSTNPHFLFHGTNIHNLSRILLLTAWESNIFSKGYVDERGQQHELVFQDVVSALTDPAFNNENGFSSWSYLFDNNIRSRLTSIDPMQLNALIMYTYQEVLPCLSQLMRHSFCKSILHIHDFLNKTTGEKWSLEETWDRFITPRIADEISSYVAVVVPWKIDQKKISLESGVSTDNPLIVSSAADFLNKKGKPGTGEDLSKNNDNETRPKK